MITVYYLTRDCGDGFSTVDFFRSHEIAERLTLEVEYYMMNEDVPSFQVPDVGTISFQDHHFEPKG